MIRITSMNGSLNDGDSSSVISSIRSSTSSSPAT